MGDEHKGVGAVGGVVAALGLALVKVGGACSHAAVPLAEVGARAGSKAARLAGEGALLGSGARALGKGAALEAGERALAAGSHAAEDGAHATGALGTLRSGEHGVEDLSRLAVAHAGGAAEHESGVWETLIEQAPDLASNAMDLLGDDDSPQPANAPPPGRAAAALHDPLLFMPGDAPKAGATAEQNIRRVALLAPDHLPVGVIGRTSASGRLVVPGGDGLSEAALHQACLEAGGRCLVLACAPEPADCPERAASLWQQALGTSRTYGELTWRLAERLGEPAGQGIALSYVLPDERRLRRVQARPAKAR